MCIARCNKTRKKLGEKEKKKKIAVYQTAYAFNTISAERVTAVEPMASELANQTGSGLDPIVDIKSTLFRSSLYLC